MTISLNIMRRAICAGTALSAIAILGAGAAMVAATPAVAQDYSQVNATGTVVGADGQPIAGATVTVTSNDQGFTRTVTTGENGTFRVAALPQGSYTFAIQAEGYDSFTDPSVSLTQGQSANQFTLSARGASASGGDIVVTGRRTQVVDFDRNTTGAVINVGELATRVPVARDLTSVVLLAPGTVSGDTSFTSGGDLVPSVAGSSVSENAYYINGLNITNFTTGIGAVGVPFDFYQTIEVKTGAIPPEFGRFTGGFINATSKSGTNDFHGGVTFNWEPNDLRDKLPNTYATDNDSRTSDRREMIAQLSGPIIKDHLFFYGLYQTRNVVTGLGATGAVSATGTGVNGCATNPQFCAPFPGPAAANLALTGTSYARTTQSSPFYGGKIDAVIVDGQRLEFTYFNTSATVRTDTFGNATSGTIASGNRYNLNTNAPGRYNSTNVVRRGGENYVGRYTGTFTNWLTLSAAYGRNTNLDGTSQSSTIDFPSIVDSRTGAGVSLGNPTANSTTNEAIRKFYRADADVYVSLFGNHHIRGGYDREDLDYSSFTLANGNYQLSYFNSGANGDGTVTTPNTQYVTRRYFQNGGQFSTRGTAYYLQDSWTLFQNRLSLVLGVRNDRFTNKNADGETFFDSKNNWSPRLSVSFDPTGDGQTKVFGAFNRYFVPVATNTNLRLAGPELDYTQYYLLNGLNANNTAIYGAPIAISGSSATACPSLAIEPTPGNVRNCTVNSDGISPPFNSLVSSNLAAQSTDEYQAGIEHRLGSRVRVGAYYTQRKLNESLEDAYIDAGVQAYCRRTQSGAVLASCLATFSGAHQYALLNPGKEVNVVLDGSALNGQAVTLTAADIGLPKAERTYKAMTFTFDRDFDGKWSLSANYTLSALVGNIEGGVRSDNGQADSGLTTNFDYPALVNGAYGYLPNHSRHNIKVYGSYQLLDILNVGANLQVQSPRKFGCIGRVPNSVDGGNAGAYGAAGFYCVTDSSGAIVTTGTSSVNTNVGGTTGRLTPRGSRLESDWLYNLNLDISLRIPTDAFDGTLRLSVFNVLNTHQVTDLQENGTTAAGAPSPLYGLPTTYQNNQPRYVRVQFGVNF